MSVLLGCMVMVEGCHTDKVYLQPIKEIKFLDDWKEKFEAITEKFETTGDDQDSTSILKLKILFMIIQKDVQEYKNSF